MPKRSWVEGNQLVTESNDGEMVVITKLSAGEQESRTKKLIDVLKKSRIDVGLESKRTTTATQSSNQGERDSIGRVSSQESKGKGRATSVGIDATMVVADREEDDSEGRTKIGGTGLSMERTGRIIDPDDDDELSDSEPSTPPPRVTAHQPAARPTQRSNSALRSVRHLLTKRNRSPPNSSASMPPPDSRPLNISPSASSIDLATGRGRTVTSSSSRFDSRGSSPSRSIKFVEGVTKPPRIPTTGNGNGGTNARTTPTVGSTLGMRRVNTSDSLGLRRIPTNDGLSIRRIPTTEASIRFAPDA